MNLGIGPLKCLARLLQLVALMTAPNVPAWAVPQVSVGTDSGAPGETVEVAVTLSDGDGAVGLQIDLLYDASRLSPASPDRGTALADHIVASSIPQLGVWRLVVYSTSNAGLGNGTVLLLPFGILPGAADGLTPLVPTAVFLGQADATAQPTGLEMGGIQIVGEISDICLGDVSLDRLHSVADSVQIIRHITGEAPLDGAKLEAGDVNGDGRVDVQDAVILARHLLRLELLPGCL